MKNFISAMAMAAVATTTLGSMAFAQSMIGGQQMGANDMAQVTAYCGTLKSDGSAAGSASGNMASGTANTDSTKGTQAGDGTASGGSTNNAAASGTTPLDMTKITAADCKAAGIKTMD